MKQLTLLSKRLLILLSIVFLIITIGCNACNTIDKNISTEGKDIISSTNAVSQSSVEEGAVPAVKLSLTEESFQNYTISFKNSLSAYKFYRSDKFSFDIIQLQNTEDLSIEITANKNIKNAMTSWINDEIDEPSSVGLYIFCNSQRYLSFLNSFEYTSRRTDFVNDYVTIDMKTGKRIMLNDLVEINEDFINYIQKNDIAKYSAYFSFDTAEYVNGNLLNEIESSDLLEKIKQCSFTQEQVFYDDNPLNSIGTLIFRNSFFVQDNILVIVLQRGGETYVMFSLDKIADYLKVDKW